MSVVFTRIKNHRLAFATGLSLLAGCTGSPDEASTEQHVTGDPDQVLVWNQVTLSVIQPAPSLGAAQNPVFQGRDTAIVAASVFDAVNSITGDYEPYLVYAAAPAGATANAAAAGAAYYALKHLNYAPPLTPAVAAQIDAAYSALPASISTNPGFDFGQGIAAQIIAARSTDGAPTAPFSPYTAPGAGNPGVWVSQPGAPGALTPTWGSVTPWIVNAADQFFPDPPPALDSPTFLADLAEVESVGYRFSTTRTALQTNVANFWIASAAAIWNPIARKISAAKGLTISENARLFALLNLAMADGAIECWKTKFTYNFWRPITAIQHEGHTAWVPFIATPPFPEYTSGHTVISSAGAHVLAWTFGDDPRVPIEAVSPSNPGFTHYWNTFSQGVDEVIDARVWSGIHYRNSDVVGAQFGAKVGQFDVHHALRAVPGHRPSQGQRGVPPGEHNPTETSADDALSD